MGLLTHGDLAELGIGHEPWCPTGKVGAPAALQGVCWCDYDTRATRAEQVAARILDRNQQQ